MRRNTGHRFLVVPVILSVAGFAAAFAGRMPSAASALGAPAPARGVVFASFDAAPTGGPAPLVVQFMDRSLGTIDSWSWEFGDGVGSNIANPTHTYTNPGVYSVTLTVSGPTGQDTLTLPGLISVDALPEGFVDELVTDTLRGTTGFCVRAENDIVAWRKKGEVWRWFDGAWCPEPLADISEEVANWNDHGLHGFVFDPDYDLNGYVYLYYVVDRHHLDHFGTPAYDPQANDFYTETIGRVTRYAVFDPSDPATTVDPTTRTVLVGEDIVSGIPICAASHGVGLLAFGVDGSLLLSSGDSRLGAVFQEECVTAGIFRPKDDVGAMRSQLVDGPNGKIHRIDPLTGDGLSTNPFYDAAAPRSWRSRVWALGLRQPYRFAVRPDEEPGDTTHGGPGTLYVGDVGLSDWEEISVVTQPGQNFGWPLYESYVINQDAFEGALNLDAPNPLFPQPGCSEFFRFEDLLVEDSLNPPSWPNPCDAAQEVPAAILTFEHVRPAIAWSHRSTNPDPLTYTKDYDAQGNAILRALDSPASPVMGLPFFGNSSIGGTWYTGNAFPAPYQGVYFHGDFGEGWIKALGFDANDELVSVHGFGAGLGNLTFLATDPDQNALYYLRYWSADGAAIRRIVYGGNAAPSVEVSATPGYGAAPLRVDLSAAGSSDPEGGALSVSWDFGQGQPWSPLQDLSETVDIYPSVDVTASILAILTPAPINLEPLGSVMTDGLYAPQGSQDLAAQVVIEHSAPWLGYLLAQEREVVALIFQEGLNQGPNGGRLDTPSVEFLSLATGLWEPVQGLEITPSYPGDLQVGFETFHLSFDSVYTRQIRLRDLNSPAGPGRFTVGELRVIATPDPAPVGPSSFVATVTVADDQGAESSAAALVSPNNTPPEVTILSPAVGQTYPVDVNSTIPLEASLSDAEHPAASLACEWQAELVHDSHVHPEALDPNCSSSIILAPHGELQGQVIYWRFQLRVTDPQGLSTTLVQHVIPDGDCNLNGIDDSVDVAFGAWIGLGSVDRNDNGVPDECEDLPDWIPAGQGGAMESAEER